MATTTPNYGWAVPTSTDLVKDGATAIETLGDAIDASMNTALGTKKAGMVLLNTTSFSGVAGQVLPANTFTSTYTRYRILISATGSTNQLIYMRLRTGATDSTTAYGVQGIGGDAASVFTSRTTPGFWEISNASRPAGRFVSQIELFNPQLAAVTYGYATTSSIVLTDTTQISQSQYSYVHDVATSYDTANIYTSTGTMTGSVSVYGYNI